MPRHLKWLVIPRRGIFAAFATYAVSFSSSLNFPCFPLANEYTQTFQKSFYLHWSKAPESLHSSKLLQNEMLKYIFKSVAQISLCNKTSSMVSTAIATQHNTLWTSTNAKCALVVSLILLNVNGLFSDSVAIIAIRQFTSQSFFKYY